MLFQRGRVTIQQSATAGQHHLQASAQWERWVVLFLPRKTLPYALFFNRALEKAQGTVSVQEQITLPCDGPGEMKGAAGGGAQAEGWDRKHLPGNLGPLPRG